MDLLAAVRDLGVADPATDSTREQAGRAALAREIDQATAAPHPGRQRRSLRRMRVAFSTLAAAAAAGAAVVVATGAIGGSNGSSNLGGGSPGSHVGAVAHGQDVAYVVGRVRAHLAAGADGVIEYPSTDNGHFGFDTWGYVDSQTGAHYVSSVGTLADGTVYYTETQDGTPSHGGLQFKNVYTDPIHRIYTVYEYHMSTVQPLTVPPAVQHLQDELKSGQATPEETVTLNRRSALKISISPSQGDQGATSTLYVDPQSYEPIRFTQVNSPIAVNWLPATPANIAKAEPQIPAGYTQVPLAQFNKTADENSALLKRGG